MSDFRYGDDRLEKIFEEQVPASGKSENLLGEIARAWMRICYRWMNDGDQIGSGYGKETCNQAARFLAHKISSLHYLYNFTDREDNCDYLPDEEYENRLVDITREVRKFVDENYDRLIKLSTEDYQEAYYMEEYDTEYYEEDEEAYEEGYWGYEEEEE